MKTTQKACLFSLLGMVLLTGCSVDRPASAGRPCSDEQPCGPGATCDPLTNTCRADTLDASVTEDSKGDKDLPQDKALPPNDTIMPDETPPPDGRLDLPLDKASPLDLEIVADKKIIPDKKIVPDKKVVPDKAPPPDMKIIPDKKIPPDKYIPKDQGCPKGTVKCGYVCINPLTDFKHCGGCNKSCPAATSNKCVNGKCSCGTAGALCSGDRNCVSGTCKCITGGLCSGCCSNNACLFLGGAGQSATKCGKGGVACKSCVDGNQCTDDMCIVGACVNPYKFDGTTCNDGLLCSHSDKCVKGTCKGTTYSCSDNRTCTKDTCTGLLAPNHCTHTIISGYCLIAGVCYSNTQKNPTNGCQRCDTSKSTSAWTTITGCGSGITVSTLVPTVKFTQPMGLEATSSGDIIVGDSYQHKVWRISGTTATVIAGTGVKGYQNGPVTSAMLSYPSGMAIGPSGAIYVSDSNNVIRLINGGQVSTFAGSGQSGYLDGSVTQAKFNFPYDVVMDASGAFYVADMLNYRVRKIYNGQVSTFAGSGWGYQDGIATSAKFGSIYALDMDSAGKLYVADTGNNCIRMISGGTVSTYAGVCGAKGFKNGATTVAWFDEPYGIAVSASGKVYVADRKNHRIRLISGGQVSTLAGTGVKGYKDGAATTAQFYDPHAVAVHYTSGGKGKVFVADYYNHKIRLITLTGAP